MRKKCPKFNLLVGFMKKMEKILNELGTNSFMVAEYSEFSINEVQQVNNIGMCV